MFTSGSLFGDYLDWFGLKSHVFSFPQPKFQWGTVVYTHDMLRTHFLITRVNLRDCSLSLYGFDYKNSRAIPTKAATSGQVVLADVPPGEDGAF